MTSIPPPTDGILPPSARHVRQPSRAPTPGQERRPAFHRSRTSEINAISDRATASFVRRTLCAHVQLDGRPAPIDELLPPLTSSNETDLQIYAIVAVVLKEVVQQWYSKITPDHVFVDEIIAIIAHCTRSLEQRVRLVDWEALLLDELPDLILTHVQAVRSAKASSTNSELSASPQHIYHVMQSHPALSPIYVDLNVDGLVEPIKNEEAWSQMLSQGILAVLLPTDDLENRCLRVLVGEILSEMVIGNVLSKLMSEPVVLLELIARTLDTMATKRGKVVTNVITSKSLDSKLEQPRLPASNETRSRTVTEGLITTKPMASKSATAHASRLMWIVVSAAFLAFTTARSVVLFLVSTSSIPSRYKTSPTVVHSRETSLHAAKSEIDTMQPILAMQVWGLVGTLVQLDIRMPWLTGLFALLRNMMINGIAKVGSTNGRLDRYLSHTFQSSLRSSVNVPTILRNLRAAVFPNNTFPKSSSSASADSADPAKPIAVSQSSEDDVQILKQRCAQALVTLLPDVVARMYFCPGWLSPEQHSSADTDQDTADSKAWRSDAVNSASTLFNILDDKYMNKHLIFGLTELVLVRLMPELGENSITVLLAERLGNDRAL